MLLVCTSPGRSLDRPEGGLRRYSAINMLPESDTPLLLSCWLTPMFLLHCNTSNANPCLVVRGPRRSNLMIAMRASPLLYLVTLLSSAKAWLPGPSIINDVRRNFRRHVFMQDTTPTSQTRYGILVRLLCPFVLRHESRLVVKLMTENGPSLANVQADDCERSGPLVWSIGRFGPVGGCEG